MGKTRFLFACSVLLNISGAVLLILAYSNLNFSEQIRGTLILSSVFSYTASLYFQFKMIK